MIQCQTLQVFSEEVILREEKKFMYTEPTVEESPSREERRRRSTKLDLKQVLGLRKTKKDNEGEPPSDSTARRSLASPSPSATSSSVGSDERPGSSRLSSAERGGRGRGEPAARGDELAANVRRSTGRRGVKRPRRYSPTPSGSVTHPAEEKGACNVSVPRACIDYRCENRNQLAS